MGFSSLARDKCKAEPSWPPFPLPSTNIAYLCISDTTLGSHEVMKFTKGLISRSKRVFHTLSMPACKICPKIANIFLLKIYNKQLFNYLLTNQSRNMAAHPETSSVEGFFLLKGGFPHQVLLKGDLFGPVCTLHLFSVLSFDNF